jgi:heme A synthase
LLTVGITVLAMTTGMIVTTFRVGMVDPVWPTYPWHLMLISWEEPSPGYVIEHSHRALDYLLGICVIVQAGLCWRFGNGRWIGWLGVVGLLAVIVQGMLGGLRVVLHAWDGPALAACHGVFGQLVLALLVSIALVTSRTWTQPAVHTDSAALRRWSLATVGLVLLQLVLGAVTRHTQSALGPRGHLLIAFAVVTGVAGLMRAARDAGQMSFAVKLLGGFLVIQLLLGVEAWMARFASGRLADYQPVTVHAAAVRTLHALIGSWILAIAVTIALRAQKRHVWSRVVLSAAEPLEGAA